MNAVVLGNVAELFVSPDFRNRVNLAWEQAPETYSQQQMNAEDIVYRAMASKQENITEANWEMRRLAALATIKGTDLGVFEDFIHERGGENKPTEFDKNDLDLGNAGPVKTNSIIKSALEMFDDPIDFLNNALGVINQRRQLGPHEVGPENYATALKYFTDKYKTFPSANLDRTKITELVERCTIGFTYVASKDKPNFVEMTNIYHSMSVLPKGVFPTEFTTVLVEHSLEQLPTYHKLLLIPLFRALAKTDNTQSPRETAMLIDLSMRHFKGFETTQEMRMALRAIANLRASTESNRAFQTFLEFRNNLEEPMDIVSLDETNDLLVQIVEKTIDDATLTEAAKEMAKNCASQAVALFRRADAEGSLTDTQLDDLRRIVDRTVTNWSKL